MTLKIEQDEVLRMALEALDAMLTHMGMDEDEWTKPTFDQARVAITALREALAGDNMSPTEQAEQEPVAWGYFDSLGAFIDALNRQHGAYQTPLYAAPVRTKDHCNPLQDLTDDEIMKINVDTASIVPTCDRQFHFARAVIAADREKNK